MSYYGRGGIQRGDYYRRGDIWGDIGGAIKRVVGAVLPVVGGVVGGPVGAAVGGAVGGRLQGGSRPGNPTGIQLPGGITMNPGNAFPGGLPLFQPTSTATTGGACATKGTHLNKQKGKHGPKGTYCVRNRKMNVTNARALRRALRRAEGFEKIARRTVSALRSGPRKFKKRSSRN